MTDKRDWFFYLVGFTVGTAFGAAAGIILYVAF